MMILVLFFVFISLTILMGVVTPTVREYKIAGDNFKSKQTYFLAESGMEDVIYRLRNNKQTNDTETLVLGDSQVVTSITNITSNQKEVISLGDIDSIQRRLKIRVNTGVGASFSYGILAGNGGLSMDNGSKIEGSVYANGSIIGSGEITGSATSANSPALTSNQSNGTGIPLYDITFGKTDAAQDFAQSFTVNETGLLNKIQLYIKKFETPGDITVRIVTDSNGSPSTTTLAEAVLTSSLLSTNYGYIDIPLTSHIELFSGTTYWFVLDADTDSREYYKIGGNSNGYVSGTGKMGRYGNTWVDTSPSGLDGFFSLYLGGVTGLIDGVTVGTDPIVTGNTYAHTVNNTTVKGINYCQIGSNNTDGNRHARNCDTSRVDPVQVAMPISEQNIQDWKDLAVSQGGTIVGDKTISSNETFGPKKITGNLTIDIGKTLTLAGTVWVEGNFVINNNSFVSLDPIYGSSGGIIIVDGTINIGNNVLFSGSGIPGSYVLAITTSDSSSAILLSNNAGAVILYAGNGTIDVANNSSAKSLTGKYLHLGNNAVVQYEEGITNANFSSGPGGTWNIESWREVE